MLDVFAANPAFTLTELSLTLNKIPYVPGLISRLGLFRDIRLSTTTTAIEVQGDRLQLAPELPRGAPPTPVVNDRASLAAFKIPHFPIRDTIWADSVQNLRAFGGIDSLQSVYAVVAERERRLSQVLDWTLEYLRLGAVKGLITTAANRVTGAPEVQLDLFQQFHVTPQPVVNWPILNAGAQGGDAAFWSGTLTGMVLAMQRGMANEISGGAYQRVHGIAGWQFFDAWCMHPEVRAPFLGVVSAPNMQSNLGSPFEFRGVTVEEYRGSTGSNVVWVAPDECHFFPVGVPDLFVELYAPADYMETVNTLAQPRYSKMEELDWDKGVALEAQMNVLPICTSPRALFTVKATGFSAAAQDAFRTGPVPPAQPHQNGAPARPAR